MIKRVDRGKNHWYVDVDTDRKVPGVTTLLDKGVPKPALINWAGNATAEAAIDRWEEFAAMAPAARLNELKRARYGERDRAAKRGTEVHDLAEKLVHGERVAVPDELAGHVNAYVAFLDEFDAEPVLVERTVHSAAHDYCGTLDLVADLVDPGSGERVRWLLDVKTNRSGVYGETALQLAAYRYADVWVDEAEEVEHDMPEVDRCGVVHVRADGYSLIPVEAGEHQHRQFLYAAQIAAFTDSSRDLVGDPIASPTTSTYRLMRDTA